MYETTYCAMNVPALLWELQANFANVSQQFVGFFLMTQFRLYIFVWNTDEVKPEIQ